MTYSEDTNQSLRLYTIKLYISQLELNRISIFFLFHIFIKECLLFTYEGTKKLESVY